MGAYPTKENRKFPQEDLWEIAENLILKLQYKKNLNEADIDIIRDEWSKVIWALKRIYPNQFERVNDLKCKWRIARASRQIHPHN